ncbi:MAG: ABC transporter ATP-binding protein [Kiritimatiellae bacterium]|nr:ABC transporter ATP-binding protein [Kiritimatiellia bacterium]
MTNKKAEPETIAQLTGVSKVFRDFWRRPKVTAVQDLTLSIRPGEVFGLLGPNGSGKSTTIKMLLGLLHPTSGNITVLGRNPTHTASKARIGYLPEESHLYQYLTAKETLDFYARLFAMESRTRQQRIEELLDMVGLSQSAQRPVGEFSKGMARRIGLAQALLNDPDLIVLDEPTSGLDPIGTRQVKDLILALSKRGKTVLLCSHLLADVEDVCDRIAILYGGRLQAEGNVQDLLQTPGDIRLTLPHQAAIHTEELTTLITKHTGIEPAVDHPALRLEEFFLHTIQKAGSDASKDPDDSNSRSVANYLSSPTDH